jgi:carbon-monoxide dehydrogenase medium subunit
MKPSPFAYHRPATLTEAAALLARLGPNAKVTAGGQSLLPTMAMRLAKPSDLIDLGAIAELSDVATTADAVRIGATATYAEILATAAPELALLRLALPHVANLAVRNRGTLGGSLCHADPSAETAGALLALDARVELVSTNGRRVLPLADFLRGVFQTALRPGEILAAILVPRPAAGWVWFDEHVRRHGDFAVAGLALAARRLDADGLHGVRIAVIGLGDRAVTAPATMAALDGRPLDAARIATALAGLADDLAAAFGAPVDDDHRLALATDLLDRALAAARAAASETRP